VISSSEPDPVPQYQRIELHDVFELTRNQERIPWTPFRDGIDIHRLYGDGITGPTAALIRFRKAGKIPLHQQTGYEHILVLAGSQRDQNGRAATGTLMINPPGSAHSVVGEAGCLVLAIYEKPVAFLEEPVNKSAKSQKP
jgi:anti-sigma factor ChrR (cupin superfamily)